MNPCFNWSTRRTAINQFLDWHPLQRREDEARLEDFKARADDFGVVESARAGFNCLESHLQPGRVSINEQMAHVFHDVRHRDDPSREQRLTAEKSGGVARAVHSLVVLKSHLGHWP